MMMPMMMSVTVSVMMAMTMLMMMFMRNRFTMGVGALFSDTLTFNCGMGYAVFLQLFLDRPFDHGEITISDYMKCCCIAIAIHAPNMQMMNLYNPVYRIEVFHDFRYVYIARSFFQKDIQHRFQVL